MKRRTVIFAPLLALLGMAAAPPAAVAEHRDSRRNPVERRRRDLLRDRLQEVAERLRLAEREHYISPREAERSFDRIARVRNFLRDDRYLTESEFDRRMEDLDEIEGDLRSALGSRYGRFERRYRRR